VKEGPLFTDSSLDIFQVSNAWMKVNNFILTLSYEAKRWFR
jgi:hypothetical protein